MRKSRDANLSRLMRVPLGTNREVTGVVFLVAFGKFYYDFQAWVGTLRFGRASMYPRHAAAVANICRRRNKHVFLGAFGLFYYDFQAWVGTLRFGRASMYPRQAAAVVNICRRRPKKTNSPQANIFGRAPMYTCQAFAVHNICRRRNKTIFYTLLSKPSMVD
jgi:hypothetical protein